jgi:hypothetical protein
MTKKLDKKNMLAVQYMFPAEIVQQNRSERELGKLKPSFIGKFFEFRKWNENQCKITLRNWNCLT